MMKKYLLSSALLLTAGLCAGEFAERWDFNDSVKPLVSKGENALTLSGNSGRGAGIVGAGARLNGKDQYLAVMLPAGKRPAEEMTVSCWFKAEKGTQVWAPIRHLNTSFSLSGTDGFSWYEVTGVNKRFYGGYAHPQKLQPGVWYHIAMTYDQKELAIYFDGVKIQSVAAPNGGAVKFGPAAIQIGGRLTRYNGKWGGFFKGTLDEVEILGKAKKEWHRVRLLKKRETLRKIAALTEDAAWQDSYSDLSSRIGQCADDAAALPLLKEAAALENKGLELFRSAVMHQNFKRNFRFAPVAVSAMKRVMPGDTVTAPPAASLKMDMAANERENLQLFLFPLKNDFQSVQIRLPETLTAKDGTSRKFDLKISELEYTKLVKPSHWMYQLPVIPDRLHPGDFFERKGASAIPLWLEAKALPGTPSGVYSGKIELTDDQGNILLLPLELRIRNFELPLQSNVPTSVGIWERDIQTYVNKGDGERFIELLTAYAEMLQEHRLDPVILSQADLVAPWLRDMVYPNYRVDASGKVQINWTYFDRIIDKLRAKGMKTVVAGPFYRNVKVWAKEQKNAPAIWKAVTEHLRQKNLLQDACAYPADEWSDLAKLNEIGEMLKKNVPELRWLVTAGSQNYPDPAIRNVGIWVPQLHWLNLPMTRKLQKEKTPVWYYVCTGPQFPTPNLHSDTPPATIRMVPVFGMRYGFDGFLHWAANFNTAKNAKEVTQYGAGEGRYIYAAADGSPVATIRLKLLADGMEDWMALELLKKKNPQEYSKIYAELARMIPEKKFDVNMKITPKTPREATYRTFFAPEAFYDIYTHPETYLAWREKLYNSLEK
jgi:hypothetical protein